MKFIALIFFLGIFGTPLFHAVADVYKYTDSSGTAHFVDSENKIPEEYRSQIKGRATLPNINRNASPKYDGRAAASSRNQNIEIFVTSWCPYCKKLEQYLAEKKLKYTRYDIEHDQEGRKKYSALGMKGVPVIKIGTSVLSGFDRSELDKILSKGSQSAGLFALK